MILSKIIGIIWILLGILWLLKPEMLKNRLRKKMNRSIKWAVFGFVIVFGFMLMGSVFKASGLTAKIVGIIGLVITVKGILLITSKTSEKIINWWAARPVIVFRLWAAFVLASGIALLTLNT